MDLQPNKIDGIVKPITNTRISASEWNQLVASCMAFITAAGFTPDGADNQQFLNAFIKIAQDMGAIGANVDLSNLSAAGEAKFAKPDLSNVTKPYVTETSPKSILPSWYRVWSDGWCEQGGVATGINPTITLLKPYENTDYSILCLQQGTSGDYNANLRAQAIDTN